MSRLPQGLILSNISRATSPGRGRLRLKLKNGLTIRIFNATKGADVVTHGPDGVVCSPIGEVKDSDLSESELVRYINTVATH